MMISVAQGDTSQATWVWKQQIEMSTDRHAACGKIYDDLCGAGRHLTSELGVERQQIDVSTKTYF